MIKKFLFLALVFIITIAFFCTIQYFVVMYFHFSENSLIIPKIYIIIGLITLMIFQIGCLIKIKHPEYVGFVFMGGMIVKMAVVLAMVIVNQEIKTNIIQLFISYFVVLVSEVLLFIRLINLKLKKV